MRVNYDFSYFIIINKKGWNLMKRYTIQYDSSNDGKAWSAASIAVNASSDQGAISQVQSMANYVKDIQIIIIS